MNSAIFLEFLLEANLCLIAFSIPYFLFLKKSTYYQGHRFFILAAFALSLIVASTRIEIVEVVDSTSVNTFSLTQLFPQLESAEAEVLYEESSQGSILKEALAHWKTSLAWLLLSIGLTFTFHLVLQWISLNKRLRTANLCSSVPNIYASNHIESAFSFFGKVYLPTSFLALPQEELKQIIAHEQAHIQLKHSYDIWVLGVLRPVFWCNPFYWLLSRELRSSHEFHVDQIVTSNYDSLSYSELLLKLNKANRPSAITSFFAQHLIKKRIMKLHHHSAKPQGKIWFALIFPVAITLFYAFSIDPIYQTEMPLSTEGEVVDKPFILPVPATAITNTSPFGMRYNPLAASKQMHRGIDFAVPMETEVYAAANGIVIETQVSDIGYGVKVTLSHENNRSTSYAHLDRFTVYPGENVKQGEIIGYSGNTGLSTGPHLHFEVLEGEEFINPELHLSLIEANNTLINQKVNRDELLIIIDAGHGGKDPGYTDNSISEKELSLVFAKSLQSKLEEIGINVLLSREEDQFISINDRSALTKNREEALFISLHFNASKSQDKSGIEIYIPSDEQSTYQKSLLFANIANQTLSGEGIETRGVKKADYVLLHNNKCPSVLMELGFLTSERDLEQLESAAYQNQLCDLIVKAINTYAE